MIRIPILLVENNPADIRAFQDKVQTDPFSYDIVIAQTVADGLRQLNQSFDVILVDYDLPDGNGLALLEAVKKDTPVIFMAASGNEEAIVKALKSGAADYILKDNQYSYIALLPSIIERVLTRNQLITRLRANETRYHSIVEDQTELVCRYDADLNITFANGAYCKFAGYSPDAIIGTSILANMPEMLHDQIKRQVSVLTKDAPFTAVVVRQPFGAEHAIRWIEWKDRAILDDHGEVSEYQAVGRDITDQKVAEEALHKSELRYRQMFELHSLPKLIIDPENGRIVDANLAAAHFYGYDAETLKTRDVFAINLSSAAEIKATMAEAMTSPINSRELIQWGANHTPRDVEVFTGLIESDGKKLLYSIITDVTEKHLAKRSLEEANNLLEQRVAERTAELEKVNNRIEAIFNHSADGLLMISVVDGIQQANRAFASLFRVALNSYIGLSLLVFVYDADRPLLDRAIANILRTHETRQIELRAVRADGTVFDIELNIAPVNQSGNAITNLVCIIRDISEQKQLERVRQESETMLQNVIENIPVQIFWKDERLIIRGANTLFAHSFGFATPAEMIGLTNYDLMAEHAGRWEMEDREMVVTGQPLLNREWLIRQPDKLDRWLRTNKVALRNSSGTIIGILVTVDDVTASKQAELAIAEERNLLRTVIDTVPDYIYLKDTQHRIVINNVAHQRSLGGRLPAELTGKTDSELFPAEMAAKFHADDEQVFDTETPLLNIEERTIGQDGREIWALTTKVPLRNLNNEVVGLVGITHDVSQIKANEAALRHSEQQLRESQKILRLVLDTIPVRVFWKDRNSVLLGCNQLFAKDAGFDDIDVLVGKSGVELPIVAIEEDQYRRDDREVMESGVAKLNYEETLTLPGHEKPLVVETSKMPLRNDQGDVVGVLGIYVDVGARKAAEQQLRYLASLQENMYDTVISTDLSYRIQSWNKAAERLYGWSAEEVIGKHLFLVTKTTMIGDTTDHALLKLIETSYWSGEAVQHHRDGAELSILCAVVRHKNEQGVAIGIIWVNHDITDRKKAEIALTQAYQAQNQMQEYLKALHEITLMLTRTETLDEFFRCAVEQGLTRFGFERIGLLLYETKTGVANGTYGTDANGKFINESHVRLEPYRIKEVLSRILNQTARFIFDSEAQLFEDGLPLGIGQNAVAALWNEELLGWISIDNAVHYAPISKAQLDILALYALTISSLLAHKRVELNFLRLSQRLELATRSGGIGIWDWDNVNDVMIWDDQMLMLYGVAGQSLTGTVADFNKALYPEDSKRVVAEVNAAINGEKPYETEFRIRWPDGTVRYLQAAAIVIRDGNGNPIRMTGVNFDITERKQAEAKLQALTQRLELATMAGNVGIWDWDITHDRLVWDDRMFALYGINAADFPGTTAVRKRSVHPDDVPRVEAALTAAIKLQRNYDIEFRVIWPDGSEHHIKANAIVLFTPDGAAERMIGVNIDITELKQAEQVLLSALEKQTELSDLKSQFVSMASHEFRTPLAVILSTTETLSAYRDKLTEAQIEARLDKIKQQVAHMKDIMDDVLQLARLQAGKSLEFKPQLLDIDALCLDIIEEFQGQPGNQDRIVYDHVVSPLIGTFDIRLVRHVISNLISNGLKYSPVDKSILVTLKPGISKITLIVQDHGIGIPPKDLTRLFEPFNRASNVGTISGTGLGLSIVKQAIEIHGGSIAVESQVDVGTTFTVIIPTTLNQKNSNNPDNESALTP